MSIPTWANALIAVAIVAALFFAVNWYNVRQQDYVFLVQYRVDA